MYTMLLLMVIITIKRQAHITEKIFENYIFSDYLNDYSSEKKIEFCREIFWSKLVEIH